MGCQSAGGGTAFAERLSRKLSMSLHRYGCKDRGGVIYGLVLTARLNDEPGYHRDFF